MEPSSPKREFPIFVDDSLEQEPQQNERIQGESGSSTHKRSLSGSIFSRFPLLRTTSHEITQNDATSSQDGSHTGGALAGALQPKKSRKRKGSLRKVALLGGRDRKVSDARRSPLSSSKPTDVAEVSVVPTVGHDATAPIHKERKHVPPPLKWTDNAKSAASISSAPVSLHLPSSRDSITSPITLSQASTSDEDEMVTFPQLATDNLRQLPPNDSYFPPVDTVKRKSSTRKTSLLAIQPDSGPESPLVEEEWDYTETAYWGYVILIVTWLVFVVGMGSCFGVWSEAWKVGATPYAPPELEDDPTLPIVGYYPAVMVLTAVMAWVWVLIAWIGLKYFRHADFKGDD